MWLKENRLMEYRGTWSGLGESCFGQMVKGLSEEAPWEDLGKNFLVKLQVQSLWGWMEFGMFKRLRKTSGHVRWGWRWGAMKGAFQGLSRRIMSLIHFSQITLVALWETHGREIGGCWAGADKIWGWSSFWPACMEEMADSVYIFAEELIRVRCWIKYRVWGLGGIRDEYWVRREPLSSLIPFPIIEKWAWDIKNSPY